jgi:hypothetical protein
MQLIAARVTVQLLEAGMIFTYLRKQTYQRAVSQLWAIHMTTTLAVTDESLLQTSITSP